MSDDRHSTPSEPSVVWPRSEVPAIEPYGQSVPPPAPYGTPTGLPVGGVYMQSTVVAPRVGGAHLVLAWVFTVFTGGYLLPWAIAATRQKSNALAIGLLNFFAGWTIIGWIAALVMSLQSEPFQVTSVAYAAAPVMIVAPQAALPGWYPDGSGARRYWDGQRWTEHTAP